MKARFLALAALVLGLASCQNDFDGANVGTGGEVDFQLSVAAPELATRAGEDGVTPDGQADLNSAYGAIDYLQKAERGDGWRMDWDEFDLRYTLEVYDVASDYANATPIKDRQVIIVDEYQPVTFELRLVPGRDYHFVVFADFVYVNEAGEYIIDDYGTTIKPEELTSSIEDQAELGWYHSIGQNLGDITIKRDQINGECTDAYFATKDIKIENSAAQDIVLQRPYGKLRVVATDLAELNLNVDPQRVVVEYTASHPTQFNAVTGEVTTVDAQKEFVAVLNVSKNDMSKHIYTAGYDAMTVTNVNNVTRYSHATLFTDYILAEKQGQTPYHFTMKVYDDKAGKNLIKETHFATDIPVQRNYLTTVIGNVLTTATEIEVRIDDNFAGEIPTDNNLVFVSTAAALQKALDNFEAGQVILFENNIEGQVTIDQNGKNYIVDGNGFEYDGTIYIDGNSNHTGADTVTIKNINFNTDSDNISFIEQNSTDSAVRYPHNVTIEGCSFNATGVDVVGIKIRQGYNIVVKDCVANGTTRATGSGMHSLAQLYGCTGVTLDGVDVNAERGISLGTSLNCLIKDSKFVANTYGIRADATVATTLAFENVDITAELPVIARKTTGDYTISFTGNNTLTAPGYQVVLTKGNDDEAFVAPESNWVLSGADNFLVFPGDNVPLYAYTAKGLQYLLDNATGDTEILFAADIVGNVTVPEIAGATIKINGRHYNYDGYFRINGKSEYKAATTVFENIQFKTADKANLLDDAFIYGGTYNSETGKRYPDNVTIKGCTFTATDAAVENAVAAKFWSLKSRDSENGVLVVESCSANGLHSFIQLTSCSTTNVSIDGVGIINGKNGISVGDAANVTIKNTNIATREYGIRANGTGEYVLNLENVTISAQKPVIARKVSKNYAINFTGNNTLNTTGYQVVFTTGDDAAAFVAPTAYTINGADNFRVFPRDITVASWDEFTKALSEGVTSIILAEDITYDKAYDLKKDVNIDLNGKSLEISNPQLMLSIHSQATIKNGTIKGKVYARKNSNITFNGVTFGGSINGGGSTEGLLQIQGSCDVYAKDCKFNATNSNTTKSRPLSVEGRSSGSLKFENCEFKSNTNQNQVYVNSLSGTATLDFTNCNFNNKTPNIMFGATHPLTNLTMTGTTKLTSVTLEINRAKDAVTADDLAYLRTMIANNSFSSVRVFYAGGSSEYIR